MTESKLTAEQAFDSLTGFDEFAIAQHFGHNVADLAENNVSMFGRALIFAVKRRDGATDDEARNTALGLSLKECNDFFDEANAEESGKGEQPEEPPGTSLSSVS